jgi:hypothetical protein
VHESLASFRLDRVANGLVIWAFPDAMNVQTDVATILHSSGAAKTAATSKLQHDLHVLDTQRQYVDKIMLNAVAATKATGKLPALPG